MVYVPYPLSGLVKDVDGSTVLENIIVTAYDFNTKEYISSVTNSSGEYMLDLANLTSGYSNGDVIYLTAITNNTSNIKKYEHYRTTVSTSNGLEEKNLTLRVGTDPVLPPAKRNFGGYVNLLSGYISETAGTARYITLREAATDLRIGGIINVAANGTTNWHHSKYGLQYAGGIYVLDAGVGGQTTERVTVTLEIY